MRLIALNLERPNLSRSLQNVCFRHSFDGMAMLAVTDDDDEDDGHHCRKLF